MTIESFIINAIGIFGVILVLSGYLLLQTHHLSQSSFYFLALNIIGSTAILFSLFFYWNAASFVIEAAWLGISLFGLFKAIKKTPLKRKKLNTLSGSGKY